MDFSEPTDLSELVAKWDGAACGVAVGYWKRCDGVELDDLLSAARLGLWVAALRYDRSVPFFGYARWWVKRYIMELIRRELSHGIYVPDHRVRKGERYQVQSFGDAKALEAKVSLPLEIKGLWETIRKHLREKEYECIVAKFRHGRKGQALADEVGMFRQGADQLVRRGLEKLRKVPELAELVRSERID